jgi:serine protease
LRRHPAFSRWFTISLEEEGTMKTPAFMIPPLVATALLAGAPSTAHAANTERVLIEYSHGAGAMVRDAVVAEHGIIHYQFDRIDALAATLDEDAAERIARNPRVMSMEPDAKRYLAAKPVPADDPTDPYEEQVMPFGIERVQAPQVWAEGYEGEGVKVCIIDTGLYVAHEDIDEQLAKGTQPEDADPATFSEWNVDGYGHGTHVAGTVSASDNDIGVIGVSPGKADLFMYKIFDDAGLWAYASDLVAAAFECSAQGANIISMSLSGSSGPNAERRAFEALYNEDGILAVAAASNDGTRQRVFPASYDSVISVAATDIEDNVADFSNQNQWVELAAPGVGVLSTVPFIAYSVLQTPGADFNGAPMEFAATGSATGLLADGALCIDSGDWSGKVVLCKRGDTSFAEKVTAVMNGGGVAAVIYNNEPGPFLGTLGEPGEWIISFSISDTDGSNALAFVGSEVTAENLFFYPDNGYEAWDGTSMATPHVAGVAALLWSYDDSLTNVQIREAMTATAKDLGEPGRDIAYGFGLVQAYDALQYLKASDKPGKGPKNR